MNTLEPPDIFHFSAAVGWFELGNKSEARDELQKIRPQFRQHPEVLELDWTLACAAEEWETCVRIGDIIVEAAPERPFGWIHRSYALHEMRRTEEAWDALLPAAELFPKDYLVPYNLACYAAQMDQLEEARFWIGKAIMIAGMEKIKEMAATDEDLKPLWGEIETLL